MDKFFFFICGARSIVDSLEGQEVNSHHHQKGLRSSVTEKTGDVWWGTWTADFGNWVWLEVADERSETVSCQVKRIFSRWSGLDLAFA